MNNIGNEVVIDMLYNKKSLCASLQREISSSSKHVNAIIFLISYDHA